jgi:predicted DNA-binding protein
MRAPFVTDRNSPVASVTTQLSREAYDRLDTVARRHGVTKSEYVRLLITAALAREEDAR